MRHLQADPLDRTDHSGSSDPGRQPSPTRASLHSFTTVSESASLAPDTLSGMRRRSSVSQRIATLADLGGPNSVRSFVRSWQRAAAFPEVLPHRASVVLTPDQEAFAYPDPQYSRSHVESGSREWTSLLRQHIEGAQEGPSRRPAFEARDDFRERERKALAAEAGFPPRSPCSASGSHHNSIFDVPPGLAGSLVGSYSSRRSYGAVQADLERRPSADSRSPGEEEEEEEEEGEQEWELPPLHVKGIERDGKFILAVKGQSTLSQTVFNSINVLVGVGLLSLPLGIKYAGWIPGMAALLFYAVVTGYTARLLGKCMDLDPSLITFSDIAYVSYGYKARVATSILFSLELLAANVALVVLFADSMDLLYPELLTATTWKAICIAILLPLNFLPLRLLSFTSIIGILSCFGIVAIVVVDGLLKRKGPGSLLDPAMPRLFPERWITLPLSFGLLLSPWGGHSVFPNIYRDMRHPQKYGKNLSITYIFTYILDAATAAAGILMFGDSIHDSVTSNILQTTGYPTVLTGLMCAFISIIPLTKVPLAARPIINTVELVCGVQGHYYAEGARHGHVYMTTVKVFARVVVLGTFLVISILFPEFDSIMAFMGSALCFSICVILPLAFYLRLFESQISSRERFLAYFLITISSVLSFIGTIWAFLPKSVIGAS